MAKKPRLRIWSPSEDFWPTVLTGAGIIGIVAAIGYFTR
jgi:hypothetical protein